MKDDSEFDLFASYAHADSPVMREIVGALRAEGLKVWFDESMQASAGIPAFADIQRSIESGLRRSRVLVALYSRTYPLRRACQWELTAAWIASQAHPDGARRLVVVNPESSDEHIRPLELRRNKFFRIDDTRSPRTLREAARAIAGHVKQLPDGACLGEPSRPTAPIWYGKPRLGLDAFVGRGDDLWDLHSTLTAPDRQMITGQSGRSVASICGFGGQGKTMLANEYALRFEALYPGGVYWLQAHSETHAGDRATRDAAVRDPQLRAIATSRGLSVEAADSLELARVLREHLRGSPRSLWIVDDLPDGLGVEELQGWLAPDESTPTLFTTRSRSYDRLLRPVVLGRLAADEGFALLTSRRVPTSEVERKAAGEIVEVLGGHPLALELAGKWLQVGASTYGELLTDLSTNLEDDILDAATALAGELPTGHAASIAGAIGISVGSMPEAARDLLRLAALLSDAPLPVRLVTKFFQTAGSASEPAARKRASEALAAARRLSLVTGGAEEPTVHPLVSRFLRLRDRQLLTRRRRRVRSALCHAMASDPSDPKHSNWLCAHAAAFAANPKTQEDLDLLSLLGSVQASLGNHRAAANVFSRLAGEYARRRGPADRSTLLARADAADAIGHSGDTDAAIRDLREVLATLLEVAKADDDVDRIKTSLAEHLSEAQQLSAARDCLQEVCESYRRRYGDHHPATVISTFNLACRLRELGEARTARELQERALEDLRSSEASDDRTLLVMAHGLGATMAQAGDRQAAIALFERTYRGWQQLLGDSHVRTIATGSLLARELRNEGRLSEARELLEPLRRLAGEGIGMQHPVTLDVIDSLAFVVLDQGEHDQALRLAREAYDASRAVFGEPHPRTIMRCGNLAVACSHAGRKEEAFALADSILEHVRTTFKESPERFAFLSNFASMAKKLGSLELACAAQVEAVEGLVATWGENHLDTIRARSNLAQTLFEQKKFLEAKQLQEQFLASAGLAEDHPIRLLMVSNLACTWSELGEHRRAAEMHRDVLRRRESLLGMAHPDTFLSLKLASEAFADCEDSAEVQGAIEFGLERLSPQARDPGVIRLARQISESLLHKDHAAMLALDVRILGTVQKRLSAEDPEVIEARKSVLWDHVLLQDFERVCEVGEPLLTDASRLLGDRAATTCEVAVQLVLAFLKRGQGQRAEQIARLNLAWLVERGCPTLAPEFAQVRDQASVIWHQALRLGTF